VPLREERKAQEGGRGRVELGKGLFPLGRTLFCRCFLQIKIYVTFGRRRRMESVPVGAAAASQPVVPQ